MKRKTKWMVILIILAGVGIVVYLEVIRALNHSLADGSLARLVAQKTAVKLQADAGYLPLAWRGASIRSDGILVRGKPPRALAEMSAVDIRAYCSLQNIWQRKWTITRLEASRLQAAFGQAAATHLQKILPSEPALQPQIETPSVLSVEIQETVVPRTDIFWGETPPGVGWLKDVETRFYPKDHDLDIVGHGGTFRQTGWPELKVDSLRVHYASPKLAVQSASFLLGPGKVGVSGEFDFGDGGGITLAVQARAIPVEPFLNGFWHGKLEGVFDSDNRISKLSGPPVTGEGDVRFARASVHDVPALKQVALVTRHPQFEKLKLDVLRGRYRWTGTRLEVTELEIESKGLFRIQGKFTIENDDIQGKFTIGAAPEVLEPIPGAREKVFTESRGAYLWTSMTLSGPMSHPREDLKQRLVSAAEEHFLKGFLAPLFKPGKALLEMLNGLYQ